jgi:hypothetical protein
MPSRLNVSAAARVRFVMNCVDDSATSSGDVRLNPFQGRALSRSECVQPSLIRLRRVDGWPERRVIQPYFFSQTAKASAKARYPGRPFSMARMARLPLM